MYLNRIEEFIDFLIHTTDEKPELWEKLEDDKRSDCEYELRYPDGTYSEIYIGKAGDSILLRIDTENNTYRFSSSVWKPLCDKLNRLYYSIKLYTTFKFFREGGRDLLEKIDLTILKL